MEVRVKVDAGKGHIVLDADGEMILGICSCEVVKHAFSHGGGKLVRAKSIPATDNLWPCLEGRLAGAHGLTNSGAYVFVKRLADCAGLFRSVQNRDGLDCGWQRRDEAVHRKGPKQMHFEHADFLAVSVEVVDDFFDRVST